MKLTFRINYHTRWGEAVFICGSLPDLGSNNPDVAQRLANRGDDWELTVDVPSELKPFSYFYLIKTEDGKILRREWGKPRTFSGSKAVEAVLYEDSWQDIPADKPLYSDAFTQAILARTCRDVAPELAPRSIRIVVDAPHLAPDQMVVALGSIPQLGNWNPSEYLRLNDANFPAWEANFKIPACSGFEYKFAIADKKSGAIVAWEYGANRYFDTTRIPTGASVIASGLHIADPLPAWRGAGTAIPVFSIRTEQDFGVGDFIDIKAMVDWCVLTGQKVLQVLPVNDTTMTGTWTDSYPYNANSTFALHPLYIRPQNVGTLKDAKARARFEALAKELNALPEIDYERVTRGKDEYLRALYAEQGTRQAASQEFRKFVERNIDWLKPYAAFSVLRDIHHTPEMEKWGEMAVYDRDRVEKFCKDHANEIGYVYFLQFHLDRQLREARDYAHSRGVVLKGDIPIGISRTSVDAWCYPHLFNMNSQAGAPPDAFSVLGQNWGFPTYNWDEMARDNYSWWKARFRKMSEYFDVYRIDHILGFFRIWQIPLDAIHGLLGIFNPALPLSPEEMGRSFGFQIDVDLHTNPFVMHWMLPEIFGDNADEVRLRYLDEIVNGRFRLKEFVNTQRKVEEHFKSLPATELNKRIRDGLMTLIDDVLFIEDPVQKGLYHPRISAQSSYQFRYLHDHQKWCFNRLYDDFFYRRNTEFWREKAMMKLPPLLDATAMLACGEDLGMIPDCVPSVMNQLKILSLEIQRMPKDPSTEFGNTWQYPYYSVCTTSTHDMEGIRAWWEDDRDRAQRYFNQVLQEPGGAPGEAEAWVCSRILNVTLSSPSMLCILPLQDWLASDAVIRRDDYNAERINIPANSRHYWRYRMHLTAEKLMREEAFNDTVRSMIIESGRN